MQIKSERKDLFFNQPLFGQTPTQSQNQQGFSQQGTSTTQNSSSKSNGDVSNQTKKDEDKVSEDQIDIESIKGRFGWTEVSNINIPYIIRKEQKYVSVRIVEQKILSKYPNSYPDEIKKRPPLESHFITQNEVKLLNEINYNHCGCEYGKKEFTKSDLIVLLTDFIEFLNFVQNTFPEKRNQVNPRQLNTLPQITQIDHRGPGIAQVDRRGDSVIKETCGWLQINNTVTPYLTRIKEKFVPVSIMKFAAEINLKEEGFLPTKDECDLLNSMCAKAGFRFVFTGVTRIISLSSIRVVYSVTVKELPSDNPLGHVKYVKQNSDKSKTQSSSGKNVLGNQLNLNQQIVNGVMTSVVSLAPKQLQPTTSVVKTVAQGSISQQLVSTGRQQTTMSNAISNSVNPSRAENFLFMSPNRGSNTIQQQINQSSQFGAMQIPFSNPLGLIYPNLGVPYDVTKQFLSQGAAHPSQSYISTGRPPPPYPFNNLAAVSKPPTNISTTVSNSLLPSQVQSNHNVQRQSANHHQVNKTSAAFDSEKRSTTSVNKNKELNMRGTPVNTESALDLTSSCKTSETLKQSVPRVVNQALQSSKTFPSMGNIPEVVANALKDALNKRKQEVQSSKTTSGSSQSIANGTISNTVVQSKESFHSIANNSQVKTKSSPVNSQTAAQQTPTTKNNVQSAVIGSIRVETVAGRSISCIHRINNEPKGKFCLVEVICRLYFNGCSVNEFLFTLKNVFRVVVYSCTDEEEKAFIKYYSLHVTSLKCNKLMNADDLDKFYPQLSYVFKSTSDQNQQTVSSKNLNTNSSNKRKADSPPDLPPSKRSGKGHQVKGNTVTNGENPVIVNEEDNFSVIILDD